MQFLEAGLDEAGILPVTWTTLITTANVLRKEPHAFGQERAHIKKRIRKHNWPAYYAEVQPALESMAGEYFAFIDTRRESEEQLDDGATI